MRGVIQYFRVVYLYRFHDSVQYNIVLFIFILFLFFWAGQICSIYQIIFLYRKVLWLFMDVYILLSEVFIKVIIARFFRHLYWSGVGWTRGSYPQPPDFGT
ncbi:hypothetical protein BDZ91DRAFT_728059 [Kalaharituber pfeilii]|nr:hypothetical protein BDZ91DRAFT_728059 [Kalaharituber pfeilii]